jgi:two-component system KDP operon response regulator KdpE
MNNTEKRPLVLVVDDHRQVLRFIEINLKLHGFGVITATSGEEALAIIEAKQPDIMLLDIIMPVMDGFEVLRRVRSFSQLPIIAFSTSITNHDQAMKLGANTFISKPFNVYELAGQIKAFLST